MTNQEAFDKMMEHLRSLKGPSVDSGGVCVYNGPITNVESYMAQATNNYTDYMLPLGANPADFALDIFCGAKGEREDWGKLYKSSSMAKGMEETFTSPCKYCEEDDETGGLNVDAKTLGFGKELWLVMTRQLLAHWRTPTYMAVRLWWTIMASVVTVSYKMAIFYIELQCMIWYILKYNKMKSLKNNQFLHHFVGCSLSRSRKYSNTRKSNQGSSAKKRAMTAYHQ